MTDTIRAAELNWFELRDRAAANQPLILPVGSLEQHGPHLPIATDSIIATALADSVAEAVDGVALPAFPYGAPSRPREGGGDRFAAPHLELPTLLSAVESTATQCLRLGSRLVVILAWHMENANVLWEAARNATERYPGGNVVLFKAPWDFLDDAVLSKLTGSDSDIDWPSDHAGLLETAVMRHLNPDLVGDAPAPVEFNPRPYEVLPTPEDAVPATGVVNDAREVTAEAGRACFEQMSAEMSAAIKREVELAGLS